MCEHWAQPGRTRLHTAMEVTCRTLLRDLGPSLIVTDSRDHAYPHDHGFAASVIASTPEAINHHADAGVLDTKTGQKTLIDFTFTNAAGKPGRDGAEAVIMHTWQKTRNCNSTLRSSRRAAHRWRSSAWSTTEAGARVRASTGMSVRLQRTYGRQPIIWSSLHLCQYFSTGYPDTNYRTLCALWRINASRIRYAVPPQDM
jgi:hypothetical protein